MLETLCSFAIVSALGLCPPSATIVVGYAEGEYVRIAPIETARLVSLGVKLGDKVAAGSALATLETDEVLIAERDAAAKLVQAQADLADLKLGRRPEEIAVQEAALQSARAQALDAERALARRSDLFDRGFSAKAELDQATTARDVANARVAELAANLSVARLPARADTIAAAESRVVQAQAQLDQTRWRLVQRRLTAPAAGRIADIVRHPGEVAGPNAPILVMLPDNAVKLKFYVPQAEIATLSPGDRVVVNCEGCEKGLTAAITYKADEPEFTPPVIYARDARQKLVYWVEARPEGAAIAALRPGQIVDITLPGAAP